MADKKMVEAITAMDVDFAQWYTDVVKKAELIDYTSVKGCMVIKPAGYAIWELIQSQLDAKFKETGVENVYLPMFIPESLLQKEKDHVEGFAPEVAWVTHGGLQPLQERLCVRPTSETLFCDFYKNEIHSYRDLPKVYNQWCSVVRWEKETRPFLRSREFLWQEGHTAHATEEEAEARTIQMLNVYARAFGIQYTDKNNQLQYVHQTSWGMTTRLIGAIIMVHGDDNGLVLPPRVAPTQVCIIPIRQQAEGVLDKAYELRDRLKSNFRVKVDDTDKSPGWKFAECEMRGIPVRVEIGPKDMEANKCVLVRRDTREKIECSLDDLETKVAELLEQIQKDMLEHARAHRDAHTYTAKNMEEFEKLFAEKSGFVKAMWCGDQACEDAIKEKLSVTSRCMPFEQEHIADTCVCCGKPATKMVYWGRAY